MNKWNKRVLYPQFLAGPTGGDLAAVVGEAGVVDHTLMGLQHQPRQTLQTALVTEEHTQSQHRHNTKDTITTQPQRHNHQYNMEEMSMVKK